MVSRVNSTGQQSATPAENVQGIYSLKKLKLPIENNHEGNNK